VNTGPEPPARAAAPRLAIIAGELSGDLLGGALITELRRRYPDAVISGVAGPRMLAAGCLPLASIESLSVMGLVEVLRHLPRLLRLRRELARRLLAERPDCVIGIDAPDFNLGLERRLRAAGLRTVHLVSPTVWAWREGRLRGIARAVDHMLVLLPFEAAWYRRHGVPATYIGHPLADEIEEVRDPLPARRRLGLEPSGPVLGVLPGSRHGEIARLAAPFAAVVARLAKAVPGLRVVTPVARPALRAELEAAIARFAPHADWRLIDGESRTVMEAADVVLLASGTAALECLLVGRPMVVGYAASPITVGILRLLGLIKVDKVSLPNLLAEGEPVPELLQEECTAERLFGPLMQLLHDETARRRQLETFAAVRSELRRNAAREAAAVIAGMLENGR
jgi:lipid-A-disaccharide synthase (EC 2.4.1.182)